MKTAWDMYQSDFDAMTDQEIESELQSCLSLIDESESWVEAVMAWRDAGKPRKIKP